MSLEGQDFGQQKEEKINPKKKELEKVLPNLNTDIDKVACFMSKFNFKRQKNDYSLRICFESNIDKCKNIMNFINISNKLFIIYYIIF